MVFPDWINEVIWSSACPALLRCPRRNQVAPGIGVNQTLLSHMGPAAGAFKALQPLFVLQEPHEGEERAVHRRRHAERRALSHDDAIEVLDLAFLPPREVLRGGGILRGHGLGDATRGL